MKYIIILFFSLLISCENPNRKSFNENISKKEILLSKGEMVLMAIKNYDINKLTSLIHPTNGVRISPHAFIITKENTTKNTKQYDLIFTKDQIKNMKHDTKKYTWGYKDGSGLPIVYTLKDYLTNYIYCADFLNAEKISYNTIIGKGNTLNNLKNVYKNCIFIEYHFSGFDPKYQGMDWKSLRLVFKKENSKYYLVGIINDKWTI